MENKWPTVNTSTSENALKNTITDSKDFDDVIYKNSKQKGRMKKIHQFLNCKIFGTHHWTCKAAEGIKPNSTELSKGMSGFKMYSQMYCKRCGKFSKYN